jgi:hypothetical protein
MGRLPDRTFRLKHARMAVTPKLMGTRCSAPSSVHAAAVAEIACACQARLSTREVPMTIRRSTPLLATVLLVLVAPPLEAQRGDLQVTVSTAGADPEARYVVSLDLQSQPVGVNGSAVFGRVPAGSHTVTLLDVPEGCTVRGQNPREAVVVAGETVEAKFAVECGLALPEARGVQRDTGRARAEVAGPVERQVQRAQPAAQDAQLGLREQMPRLTTTVRVRAYGQTGGWGTEATIHSHQEVMFLWDIGVLEVPFAEWQVWNQNPEGRSVPESAKLANGALEVTGETTLFPIHFGTFVPELPPELPAEQKYWVTMSAKDAHGNEVGTPPTPVTVSFRACSNNQQCPGGYFCDPDKKVCDTIEVFCAAGREIPGYKGTGYRKGDWGGHIQGTDGSSVRCFGYKCRSLPDGTPYCLCRCMSTSDCDQGYSCTSDNRCVMN